MADAKRIANIYAEAAGVKLAGILSIREGGSFQPQPGMMIQVERSSVPIEAGQSTVQASVTIVWEIEPGGG
ncbi:MAG TPA: SIMPL domain-containing protein [Thermohalobaculum sp.]|nr:SIMPL domain-containing protein [Thermohalobaculum sp.]